MNTILISRIIRWALGAGVLLLAWVYNSWEAFLFGGVLFVTGFFRPRRCVNDQCHK